MTKIEKGQTALVTGSSSGIGRAFARALGERGVNVALVARDRARLEEVAHEIEAAGARAEILVADLADPQALARVEERLAGSVPVDLFVNNAALGATGRFVDVDVAAAEQQVRVNVLAATRLAHAALRGMRARGRGGLVNVSSGITYFPSLDHATYSATKAYLATLSLVVTEELRGSGVDVVTVFPGFTRTEFQQRAGFDVSGVPGYLWQEASEVVAEALAALEAGRSFCVPGAHNKLAVASSHLVPYSWMGRLAGLLARLNSRPRSS